jgi:hypothetical protein
MCSKGVKRVTLSDQADEEICKIDLATEKLLASPEYLKDAEKSARLNAQREYLIAEIKKTYELNLLNLNEQTDDFLAASQTPDKLFNQFRYIIEHNDLVRLVRTDTYITPKQVDLLQKILLKAAMYPNKQATFRADELLNFMKRSPAICVNNKKSTFTKIYKVYF